MIGIGVAENVAHRSTSWGPTHDSFMHDLLSAFPPIGIRTLGFSSYIILLRPDVTSTLSSTVAAGMMMTALDLRESDTCKGQQSKCCGVYKDGLDRLYYR